MASLTAHAPHSGPVDQPGEGAYLYARAGIARSATTRSNYVLANTSIDWIVRDAAGAIISSTNLSDVILLHTLHVTQALNDEPDTCSFTLKPQDPPALSPQVGQEIRVAWTSGPAAGVTLFYGYIVVAQSDWRLLNAQPPWVAIQCQDPMWRFDARVVTYTFPAQSVSASIADLVKWFCNLQPTPGPLDFSTAFVQSGMPSLGAFDVINQRPSTVMRTLTAAVNGGFYIEGLTVHAWANSVSEPNQTNPTPLTVGLNTLHTVRRTTDATQVRRRVLVEGRRTSTLIGVPTVSAGEANTFGVPMEDTLSIFPVYPDPNTVNLSRIGPQWMNLRDQVNAQVGTSNNPFQATTAVAFAPGQTTLSLQAVPVQPYYKGWIRIGNQYTSYNGITGNPLAGQWSITLTPPAAPYGVLNMPVAIGSVVEWVPAMMAMVPHGLGWEGSGPPYWTPTLGDPQVRSHPVSDPVVTLAVAQAPIETWPPLEGFVQDGRYSYAGAQARADDDLATFRDPLVSLEWETDDYNALPGRSQVIALASDTVNPPINTTVTILRVEMSFPLRTLPPRRSCTGGIVKPSSFMDLVVTTQS